jgi:hypothetical protein
MSKTVIIRFIIVVFGVFPGLLFCIVAIAKTISEGAFILTVPFLACFITWFWFTADTFIMYKRENK